MKQYYKSIYPVGTKKMFTRDDRVKVIKTGSNGFDGALGTIIGKSSEFPDCDFYILLLDDDEEHVVENFGNVKACVLTEACLERI